MSTVFDEPVMPSLEDAISRAQAYLDESGGGFYADPRLSIPNPFMGLWIISYADAQGSEREGGGLVVTADKVYEAHSTLDADEYQGAVFPDEEDEPDIDESEISAVLAVYGKPTLLDDIEFDNIVRNFGGFDPSQPRAKDGRWNPGGGNDGPDKQPPQSDAERRRRLVEAILKTLDDVLDQMTATQAKVLIEQIKYNAKQFIQGQKDGGGGGGPAGGNGKGGKGKSDSKDEKTKPDKGDSDSGDSNGKSGKDSPSGLEAVVRGVSGLIKRFGNQMKDADREKLEQTVGKLKELS